MLSTLLSSICRSVRSSAMGGRRRRWHPARQHGSEVLESRVVLTPGFGFNYTTIASNLSSTHRFFGSPNAEDAPFTVLRYGHGQMTSLTEIGAGFLDAENITFEFGSNDTAEPVEALTLVSFDNGLTTGVSKQVYRPDADDVPTLTIYASGIPVVEGRVKEVALEMNASRVVSSTRSTFLVERAVGADTRLYDQLFAASQGTGEVPFNLSPFDAMGPWLGIGDAMIFSSTGTSLFEAASNRAPTDLSISASSILENRPAGTAIGNLTTVDPDGPGQFTYSLVAGAGSTDNASFRIDGNQLKSNASFDFETKKSYSIRIQTMDAGGRSYSESITISVLDVANEGKQAPTDLVLNGGTIQENAPPRTTVGSFRTVDPDSSGPFTYVLVNGPGSSGNSRFSISGANLIANATFDYEAGAAYPIRVMTRDADGLTFAKQFVVRVGNVEELKLLSATISENQRSGTFIGTLSHSFASDAGRSFRYEFVSGVGGEGNSQFVIHKNALHSKASFNFEEQDSYSIRVRATDGKVTRIETFTISIKNLPEPPSGPSGVKLSSTTVDENVSAGTNVGTLSAIDNDGGTFRYFFKSGTGSRDNRFFRIVDDKLSIAEIPDFERKPTYSIRVQTFDEKGRTADKIFSIQIRDVNEAPTEILPTSPAIRENTDRNRIQLTTNDPDRKEQYLWELTSGEGSGDNGLFTLNEDGELRPKFVPDFEARQSYNVRVRYTDKAGNSLEKALTVAVEDVPEVEDQYLVGDWDGDGIDTFAVRRRDKIYYQPNLNSTTGVVVSYGNGQSEDEHLVGDWDGDGRDTLAVRRGNQVLYQRNINSTLGIAISFGDGNREDQYLVGDWDGDGKDTLAVRRGNRIYYQPNINSTTGVLVTFGNGRSEDQYLVGDWDGDGKDSLAVRRNNRLLYQATISSTAGSEIIYGNGRGEREYLVGSFSGNRKSTFVVRRKHVLIYQTSLLSKTGVEVGYGNG